MCVEEAFETGTKEVPNWLEKGTHGVVVLRSGVCGDVRFALRSG